MVQFIRNLIIKFKKKIIMFLRTNIPCEISGNYVMVNERRILYLNKEIKEIE